MSGLLQRVVHRPGRLLVGVAVLLTGDNLLTGGGGTLQTKDAIVLRTTGAGDLAGVDTVIGGTGPWAGASGVLRAQGRFSAAEGGAGDYVGEVCTP